MMHYHYILAFTAAITSSVLGFASKSFSTFSQEKKSWSEYKHAYVDPRIAHTSPHDPDVDEESMRKRAIADEFWMKQFEEDKHKMHDMMKYTASGCYEDGSQFRETWSHYEHDFVEPLTFHAPPKKTTGDKNSNDTRRRAKADAFWLEKFKEDKEKLRHFSA